MLVAVEQRRSEIIAGLGSHFAALDAARQPTASDEADELDTTILVPANDVPPKVLPDSFFSPRYADLGPLCAGQPARTHGALPRLLRRSEEYRNVSGG